MQYGHFDDANREYVITRPDTPLPWINYLGSEKYFGIISNTAGGYSFYLDARLRRLTRYRYNNVPFDMGGRYLFLRDNVTGDYWSPSWMPTRRKLLDYTCRHGLGYSVIGSTYHDIKAETLYFVPLGETLEVWQLTLTNQRAEAAQLSVFSSIEFCLWDAQDDATNYQRNFNTGQVEVEGSPLNLPRQDAGDIGGVIYHKTEYRERRDHFAYFACSEPLAGFDTQREKFLGPYRGWHEPLVVEQGESTNSMAHGWQPIGSHHVKVTLQPGESRTILFVLGYHENPRDQKFNPPESQTINKRTVKPIIAKYLNQANVKAAFAELKTYWDSLLNVMQVNTPYVQTNRMVKIKNGFN
jgi:cellobiose phosphorylase